jgi:branched-subunit amino acid transport protein
MSLELLEQQSGWLWPYLVMLLVGFLPTEVWRVLGVMAGKGLSEDSELFQWVKLVATALVAAVVAKLVLTPNGALATIPTAGRVVALAAGVGAMLLARRSLVVGLVVGECALIGAALLARSLAP